MNINRLILFTVLMLLFFKALAVGKPGSQLIVFVPGAHLVPEAWKLVEETLSHKNVSSQTVRLPIESKEASLDTYVEHFCRAVEAFDGRLTVVAHSQGGAVVNQALDRCSGLVIERIVYVASVSPLSGEKPFDKLSKADEDHYFSAVSYNSDSGFMEINDRTKFAEVFSSSGDKNLHEYLLKISADEPAAIGEVKVDINNVVYEKIEKFYVFTEKDKIISLASQKRIADASGIENRFSIDSGHVPMITNPKALSDVLLTIVNQ